MSRCNFSAILTSPVAEERKTEGRHDVIVEHVRSVFRHYNRRTYTFNLLMFLSGLVMQNATEIITE